MLRIELLVVLDFNRVHKVNKQICHNMFLLSEVGKHLLFVALGWSGRAPPL